MEFEGLLSLVAPLHLFPYNKQVLVIHIHFPPSRFGFLATFYWWQSWGNTYLETQIPIDNQIASRINFCSSNLLGVLAMDCFLEVIINYSESPHQTYKSPSHRFCTSVNGSLLPNIQLIFCIMHWWTSFFCFQQQGTSLSPEELKKPCLLSFSKWSKTIESKKLV